MRFLFPLIAAAALLATAKAADPMADLYSGPYIIVNKDDADVSPDILTKRPLLLMFVARLWAVRGDHSGMADDQNAFFKSLTEFLASDAGKNLTSVAVSRNLDAVQKENRAMIGLAIPMILVKDPNSSEFESVRKLEDFIRATPNSRARNTCEAVLIKQDGTTVGITSVDALKASLAH